MEGLIAIAFLTLWYGIARWVISRRNRRESELNARLCRRLSIERDRFHRPVTLHAKAIDIKGSPYKLSNVEVTIG